MNTDPRAVGLISLAAGYLIALTWAMTNVSYDLWGVMIVVPPMAAITVLMVRRMFAGDLAHLVLPVLCGFALKLVGSAARYWIAFDVYGGSSDSGRYHDYGRSYAGLVWDGTNNLGSVLPAQTGTQFVERFTSFVYTFIGSSKLAGFVFFGWLACWGVTMFIKAACLAVPGLAQRRYAWLCAIAPSIVYWPSSLGKEALMMWALGIATYGIARLLTRSGFLAGLSCAAFGLLVAALIRPHIAGVWVAGVFPALLVSLGQALRRGSRPGRRGAEIMMLISVVLFAAMALVFIGQFALRYLKPGDETASFSDSVTAILDETTRRSDQGGSNFSPPVLDGPQDWPLAVVRTLTRPLPNEASGLLQLLSAAEMTALIGLCLLSWRRMLGVPRSVLTIPYVAFAMTSLFAAGLAYTSFANLGILTRQKSLVFPLLLLIPCLPLRSARTSEAAPDDSLPERELVTLG